MSSEPRFRYIQSQAHFGSSPMRMSRRLQKTQAELDFVDIDPTRDTPLYIDPQLIAASPHPFAETCHAQLGGFFQYFLDLLRTGHSAEARTLFSHLHEPNETCLGQSRGVPSGRGIGSEQADQLFVSISESRAAATGVLEHLEDCALFIDNIGGDKISDMTTNILRGPLVAYTQAQCELHRLAMRPNTLMGPIWESNTRQWSFTSTDAFVIEDRPILFVPKSFVSVAKIYTLDKYHRHFVLEHIRADQLARDGPFVRRATRRDGSERVWVVKKELQASVAPAEKDWVSTFTASHPAVFRNFRQWALQRAQPLSSADLPGSDQAGEIANFLAERLTGIQPGNNEATAYHDLVLSVLELLFYPSLTNPRKEREIHDGRKRIDITFDNAARQGFFWHLHQVRGIPSPYIMVECKNYGREVGNPEVDQLSGRFGVNRGKVGMLLCRSLEDRGRLIQRCQDTFRDGRGLMLPITDEDLHALLGAKGVAPNSRPEEQFLTDLAREICLG